jgi:cobalt-zinc-cadmium efflux system outer membrane protein
VRVYTQLADAYQAMATAHAQAGILREQILPEAQKAFDASSAGYQQGKFAYLDVLDAQRTLFDSRNQYLTAMTEFYAAAADLEALVGQSLQSIANNKTQEK